MFAWGSTITCLGTSLFLVLVGAPLLRVVVQQAHLMVPWPFAWDAYRSMLNERIQRTMTISGIERALRGLAWDQASRPDLTAFQARDPDNGLWDYLQLLVLLRRSVTVQDGPTGNVEQELADAMDRCLSAKPATIRARQEHLLAEQLMGEFGLPPRMAAAYAFDVPYVVPGVRGQSLPVMRQLVERLLDRAGDWRVSGQVRRADVACRVVVRLLTDLLENDALLELVLLASEKLPPALEQLGAAPASVQAAALRDRLHAYADQDQLNWIPWTGEYALASRQQDRALGSLLACVIVCLNWVTLAIVVLHLTLHLAVTRPAAGSGLQWRWPRRSLAMAGAITFSPALIVLLLLAATTVPFTWLLSKPSAPILLFIPGAVSVSLGLATWLCVRPTDPTANWPMPRSIVWVMAVVLLVTIMGGLLLPIVGVEPWQPPALVQRLRLLGPALGIECLVFSAIWIIWGGARRRKANLPTGVWGRFALAVAAAGLLGASVISFVALAVNAVNDRLHERAFVAAAADPIADRLGPDWFERHFLPARTFIDAIETTPPPDGRMSGSSLPAP